MGQSCVRSLAEEGARVVLVDQNAKAVIEAAAAIPGASGHGLDLRDLAAINALVETIDASVGPIDHLVLTAGIFRAIAALETPDDVWQDVLSINLLGPVAFLRSVGLRMRERRAGSIVVVASQSAKVVRLRQAAYGASKAALTYAAKAFGLELAPYGVRVNVVQPGTTDTPMSRELWDVGRGSAAQHIEGSLAGYRAPIPLGKIGHADDIASSVLFLLSDAASHVTMSEIMVDGGSHYIA